jgi:hypothetical protein
MALPRVLGSLLATEPSADVVTERARYIEQIVELKERNFD